MKAEDRYQTTFAFRNAVLEGMRRQKKQQEREDRKNKAVFQQTLAYARQGNAVAQSNLGSMYESGYGVEQDIQKAIEWYTKAAGQGGEYAISRLKKLKGIQEESSGAAESPGSADSAGSTCAPWPSGSSSQSPSRFLSDSWEKIIASCRDGSYKKKYRIGDSKALDLGREGVIIMKLAAMDEDELSDGSGKAPMTWVANNLLHSAHRMNESWTNIGGWEASGMRAWLRETVLPMMTETLRYSIREVKKYSFSYDKDREVSSKDTIWIPSEKEIFFDCPGSSQGNDEKRAAYTEVFKDNTSRIRNNNNAYDLLWWVKFEEESEGEEAFRYKRIGASWWWLRSAYRHHLSYSFLRVDSEGNIDHNNADNEGGVLIGFCL